MLPITDTPEPTASQPIAAVTPPAPTPEEIDLAVLDYETAKRNADEAADVADECKRRIIALVDIHGHVPAGAEQSKRLEGRRNTATVTRGTTITVDEPAVAEFHDYLGQVGTQIFERCFAANVKHTLLEGAQDLLKALKLPRRTDEKVHSLFGRCFTVKAKTPSLAIKVIQPEKPARKPRAGKQAA